MAKKKSKLKPVEVFVGVPEWFCTFGDMMSLLLTFFILLFSVSEQSSQKTEQVYSSFERYFDLDPKIYKQIGYYHRKVTDSNLLGFLEFGAKPPSKHGEGGTTATYSREPQEAVDDFVSHVKEQNNHLVIVPGAILFDAGKAAIKPAAIPSILKLVSWLGRNRLDLKIVGHTSSLPLDKDADAADHMTLGYLRAWEVAKFISGTAGDLSGMALQSDAPGLRSLAATVHEIPLSRITLASMGSAVPEPSRRELWIDPLKDDRVEILLLPAAQKK